MTPRALPPPEVSRTHTMAPEPGVCASLGVLASLQSDRVRGPQGPTVGQEPSGVAGHRCCLHS